MKVALVYDRVNKFGGAERVLLALHKIFPDAPLYTLVFNPKRATWAKEFKVIPTFINKISFLRNKHEILAPIAAMAFESLDLRGFDVVISITSSDAKAVITKPNQLHICYCLTPTRYFWSGKDEYEKDTKFKVIPKFLQNYFRTTDLLTSYRPDRYIAISDEVKRRIFKYYHRDSTVIYPSIDDKFYSKYLTAVKDRHYYLVVSRLVPYKRVDLAIKVFNILNFPLVVVGTGSEFNKLKKQANKNITFTGAINDSDLIKLYQDAKAVIFPQEEDYGLVPIEAQASGTPVIAFERGGAKETIEKDKTGIFFSNQSSDSLEEAIHRFESTSFTPQDCFENSQRFNSSTFAKNFKDEVNKLWLDHLANTSA